MYKLDARFAQGHFPVTVVGCGGTGGFVAEGLARLLPARAELILIDHDVIDESNLRRQNFYADELGQFKSEALALRLSRRYGRPVRFSTLPVADVGLKIPGLVIGCVDNGLARQDIAEKSHGLAAGGGAWGFPSWWVDSGNGENFGQVLIGNSIVGAAFSKEGNICAALPIPTYQRPDLMAEAPPPAPGCAQLPEQGPTINQAMAALVVEVVRRIIEGSCPWMQLYLDLEAGSLHSIPATPEAVESLTPCSKKRRRKGGKP